MIKINWHTFHYQVRTTNPEDFGPEQQKMTVALLTPPPPNHRQIIHTIQSYEILPKQNASTHQQTRLTCGFQHVYKPSTKIMRWTQTTKLLLLNQKSVKFKFKLLINPDGLMPAFPSPSGVKHQTVRESSELHVCEGC